MNLKKVTLPRRLKPEHLRNINLRVSSLVWRCPHCMRTSRVLVGLLKESSAPDVG